MQHRRSFRAPAGRRVVGPRGGAQAPDHRWQCHPCRGVPDRPAPRRPSELLEEPGLEHLRGDSPPRPQETPDLRSPDIATATKLERLEPAGPGPAPQGVGTKPDVRRAQELRRLRERDPVGRRAAHRQSVPDVGVEAGAEVVVAPSLPVLPETGFEPSRSPESRLDRSAGLSPALSPESRLDRSADLSPESRRTGRRPCRRPCPRTRQRPWPRLSWSERWSHADPPWPSRSP